MNKESFDSKIKYLKENDKIPDQLVDYLSNIYEDINNKLFIYFARNIHLLMKNDKNNLQNIPLFIIIDPKKEISNFESDINNDEIQLNEYMKSENVENDKKNNLENKLNKNKTLLENMKSYFNTKELLKETHIGLIECYRYIEDFYKTEKMDNNNYDLSKYSLALGWMLSEWWHKVDLIKKNAEKEKKEYKEKGHVIFMFDDYYVSELLTAAEMTDESSMMNNCIKSYADKVSPDHRFFSVRKVADNMSIIDAEFKSGKFLQIKGVGNKEIPLKHQFVFLQFLYNLCNYDQEKIDEVIGESSDYANFGEQETLPNGEIQFFYTYKGEKYILEKFEKIEDPE